MNLAGINTDLTWRIVGIASAPLFAYIAVCGWEQVVEWWPGALRSLRHSGTVGLIILAAADFVLELCKLWRHVRKKPVDDDSWCQLVFWVAYMALLLPGLIRIGTKHPAFQSAVSPIAMGVMVAAFVVLLGRTVLHSWRAFFDGLREARERQA